MVTTRSGPLLILAAVIAWGLFGESAAAQSRDRYLQRRLHMVEEYIVREGIRNPRVLQVMKTVPRHEFVLPADRNNAYFDGAMPIGFQQTISPPFIVAYMTELIDPQKTDRVLEIGTGSGYQAAVLSGLAKEVYTIEIVEPLGKQAARRLKKLGYKNITTKIGDGYKGWPEHAPFDKIIVTCSPEEVPKPLVEQLKEGGKLIIPLGERYQQVFHLLEKQDGKLVQKKLIPTLFVPMTGISEKNRAVKPDPLNPRIINGDFEIDENKDGRADGWHYQRQTTLVAGDAKVGSRYLQLNSTEPGRPAQLLQGTGINGREVRSLSANLWVKYDSTVAGSKPYEKPALIVHFYDAARRPIRNSEGVVGPWLGTSDWKLQRVEIKVPLKAREMIIRVGLNGATGQLSIDDLSITRKRR